MEAELEKLVKEKEQSKPVEVIPLSAVPLTGVSTTSVVEIPSATPLTALEKTVELAKSMEEMNLQETKISRLKRRLRTFRNSSLLTKLATPRKNKHQTNSIGIATTSEVNSGRQNTG
jgi:phosphoribosylcarboxyaminoimidazole (NCAIR) mutase